MKKSASYGALFVKQGRFFDKSSLDSYFVKAAGRRILGLPGSRGSRGRGSGRGGLRLLPGGIAGAAPSAVAAVPLSAPVCACRLVVRGRQVRLRSILLWSSGCGSGSVRQPSIPVFLALCLRCAGLRSGSRCRTYSAGLCGAMCLSEPPMKSGRAVLPNSG